LLAETAFTDRVAFWVNCWRASDYIGKSIFHDVAEGSPECAAEASLGDGGHAGYWRDERLWRLESVRAHIQGAPARIADLCASGAFTTALGFRQNPLSITEVRSRSDRH
jgi:hypothetical protein